MTTQKQEFSANDAAPVVLYAKTDRDSKFAFPVTPGMFYGGMTIPEHDTLIVDTTDSNNIILTYQLSGVTVLTKNVSIVGAVITITKA